VLAVPPGIAQYSSYPLSLGPLGILFFVTAVHSWEHHIKLQKQEEETEFVLAPRPVIVRIVSSMSSAHAEVNRPQQATNQILLLLSQQK